MKISFHIPDEWKKVIRQAMTDADSPSVVQFMKLLLQESDRIKRAMIKAEVSELPSLETSWGGPRKQVSQDTQERQVDQDDTLDLPPAKPSSVIRQKATMHTAKPKSELTYDDLEE